MMMGIFAASTFCFQRNKCHSRSIAYGMYGGRKYQWPYDALLFINCGERRNYRAYFGSLTYVGQGLGWGFAGWRGKLAMMPSSTTPTWNSPRRLRQSLREESMVNPGMALSLSTNQSCMFKSAPVTLGPRLLVRYCEWKARWYRMSAALGTCTRIVQSSATNHHHHHEQHRQQHRKSPSTFHYVTYHHGR
jgi:hypothetical protein